VSEYKKLTKQDLEMQLMELPQFETTEQVECYDTVIGQKRAVESIELGLHMESKEYNIFISGKAGTGKTGYIVRKIEEYAKELPAPQDWCYVYNFEQPNRPMAISLQAGKANCFKEDMSCFIRHVIKMVPVNFNSDNYEVKKNSIIDKFDRLSLNLSRELNNEAKKRCFSVQKTTSGEYLFIPQKGDKDMTEEEYDNLSEEEREAVEKSISELRNISSEIFKQSRLLEKKLEEEQKELDDSIAEYIIAEKIENMIKNYGCNEKVLKFLNEVKKDVIENISYFTEEETGDKGLKDVKAMFLRRYEINVLVSNSEDGGAPVIFADSCRRSQVFGNIEYENKMGNLITDFTLIKPGYLHKANGGFIIVKANQLLSQPSTWELLKKFINLQAVSIDNSKYNIDVLPISTLNPEEIPLRVKIIMLGSHYIYSLLLAYDTEFEKIFKIKAEFDDEIERDIENTKNLTGFLHWYSCKNGLKSISREGVVKLLKYSSRLAENRNYYSASLSNLLKIVDISNYYARNDNSKVVDAEHIIKALSEQEAMHSLIRKKILHMYRSKKYIVDLKGERVGQINGLSVVDYGDCIIGQQHRITVSTFAGRKGIINIEREADMSGSIHSKGIMILAGFVGELVGRNIPISFNANIVFEQLYSGIEGDSASAAELLALLSSLSGIPIKQSMAITGSVNQKGEIQPIGGVNSKVEGFFDICSIYGLDGSHGVIIPDTNVEELVLKEEVIQAVEEGKYHIYCVKKIEDCIEILFEDEAIKDRSNNKDILEYIKSKMLTTLADYNSILRKSRID
jgi:lon-related putative ATP-dependent protease